MPVTKNQQSDEAQQVVNYDCHIVNNHHDDCYNQKQSQCGYMIDICKHSCEAHKTDTDQVEEDLIDEVLIVDHLTLPRRLKGHKNEKGEACE